MSLPTFNAFKYADLLKEGKIAPEQAEIFARALSEVLDLNREKLATKEDLHREISDVRKDMKTLEERIIATMTIRLGSMLFAAVGIAVGILFALIKTFIA